jgi:endoglucanase Acf2
MKRNKILSLALAGLFGCTTFLGGCRRPTPPPIVNPDPPIVETEEKITFVGAEDVTVTAGRAFDCYAGVRAATESGKDVTAAITVAGEVNTARAGEYTLTYSAAEGKARGTKTRKVIVSANPLLDETPPPVYIYEAEEPFNIAKGVAVAADATSNGSAEKAVDGDLSSRWESDHGVDLVDYTLDLGAVLPLESIVICWEAAYAADYTVQLSADGVTYRNFQSFENWRADMAGGQPAPVTLETAGEEARYVRLHLTKRVTAYGYSVFELQVFGKKGTVIPAENYPIHFDAANDRGADWAIADEQWLLIDFGGTKSFDNMELSWNNWLSPVSYDLESSLNGSDYTPFRLGDGGRVLEAQGNQAKTVSARYVRVNLHERRFYSNAYRINQINFKRGGTEFTNEEIERCRVRASSESAGFPASNALKRDNYSTCWASAYDAAAVVATLGGKEYRALPQTFDLGEVKRVGRIDLYWRGDDGRKGKYYDLQVSDNGVDYTTVFRQTHGDTALQHVYYFGETRFLRVLDWQNANAERFQLEGITVHSQYPTEQKIEYDTALTFPDFQIIETENGSYVTGDLTFPTSKLIAYLDESLREKPVPSNDWWQSLMIDDHGHAMYLNPLVAKFTSEGLALTNPGDGYYSGDNPGNGRQTINVDVRDLTIGYAGITQQSSVRVTGYSDYAITAAVSQKKGVDDMTVTLSQGALYAYCLFARPERAQIVSDNFVAFYDLNGKEILTDGVYRGDCVVACVRTHSGYENGIEKGNAREYEERYYVINVPPETQFSRSGKTLSVNMTEGNYLSVGAMSGVNTVSQAQAQEEGAHGALDAREAKLMHEHGYAFIANTLCPYSFEEEISIVKTEYRVQTVCVRNGFSNEAYTAFLPHQYKKSTNALSDAYAYKTVRGDVRAHAGNAYETEDVFYGIVPQFVEPTAQGYQTSKLYGAIGELYANVGGDKSPEESNLISGDPYWQGKNLHPMALAALAADQLGATDLRDQFLEKIEYVLEDWFTYTPGNEPHDAYFYYDTEWGTLYYKNSEFGANVNLADHHFTYGYFTLAAGVVSAFDPAFAKKYEDMIMLMIRDYMNPSHNDALFPYMRNYDVFAGHGWAGGYADNDGGNNQESAGEALNSWVGAYLYAVAVGNTQIRDAAIYGFTTELNAIKQYWFNYGGDSFGEFYPFGTLGQLYGASNFFGTFFNGEPLFMYGIHMIPGGEFLSGYALNDHERERLENVLDQMKKEQASWNFSAADESHREIYAWQHIFIPMTAMYDPDAAIAWYEQLGGKVGNTSEAFNVYHMIYAMKSLGGRTTDIYAAGGASATVYQKDDAYTAICWNPTSAPLTVTFRNADGITGSAVIPEQSLVSVDPTEHTQTVERYRDVGQSDANAFTQSSEGVTATEAGASFDRGAAEYKLSFGAAQEYGRLSLEGTLEDAQLFVDGRELPLTKTQTGYATDLVVLTFKQDVMVRASGGLLKKIGYAYASLSPISLDGATVAASSENGINRAECVLEAGTSSRWESEHGEGPQRLELTLAEAVKVYQMTIVWEAASAAEYEVYFSGSDAGDDWVRVFRGSYTAGARTDVVAPEIVMNVKRIRIECLKRTTNYGYSIFEIGLRGV